MGRGAKGIGADSDRGARGCRDRNQSDAMAQRGGGGFSDLNEINQTRGHVGRGRIRQGDAAVRCGRRVGRR